MALAILVGYLLFLSSLSLFSFGQIPSLGTEFDDKLNHFLAHGLLTLLAYNYFRLTSLKNIILLSLSTSAVYGIIIELLQLTVTTERTFDFFDMLANLLGALSAIFLLKIKDFIKLN
ncbi:VanZ like family protein [Flavobacteriaceae bacterium MAR_2010_188]|nr:VanZ like family protein [Flavobacteriaceae bacterium MAR_2010_188]